MKSSYLYYLLMALCVITSCVEENISFDPSHRLSFSSDTIVFDTLFVGQSSSTQSFMIYNKNSKALMIENIFIGATSDSKYRFNVDGRAVDNSNGLKNIVIKARDSLYVFVEFYPKHSDADTADIYSLDSLNFLCNGITQNVKLLGVGRDATLLNNHAVKSDFTMTPAKPYLVFGNLYVAENAKLTIPAGCQLFMHADANIVVDGVINIQGNPSQPVIIRGDRYDFIDDPNHTPYFHLPNQWGGIILQNPYQKHHITNARLYGMTTGIFLAGEYHSTPSLNISNTIIHNSGRYGIYSLMANLTVENSEISNCGESCLLTIGGTTYLAHSTVANYYRFTPRKTASMRVQNTTTRNGKKQTFPVNAFVVENSIIFGQNNEELQLLSDSSALFNVFFSHTLIKAAEIHSPHFSNCLWARSRNHINAVDTVFKCTNVTNIHETGYYNFRLDSLSFARNYASKVVAAKYPFDIDNYPRTSDSYPDLGAYEFHSNQ